MAEDLQPKRFTSLRAGLQFVKAVINISQRPNLSENVQNPARGPQRVAQEARLTTSSGLTESVCLFPGWAVRRYIDNDRNKFDLHVHVSGYATSLCSPPTRSQMAFLHLAKRYAKLSKFAETRYPRSAPNSEPGSPKASLSEENDLIKKLDERYGNLSIDSNNSSSDDDEELQSPIVADASVIVQRLQANLETRFKLLWPSMLSSRAVRLELFASQHHGDNSGNEGNGLHSVGRSEVKTGSDGQFKHHFVIKWDDICHHPLAHAPGEQTPEPKLILHAKLLPSSVAARNAEDSKVEKLVITLSHAPTRVISDIDDTIKMSDILSGARTVFRNVFACSLEDAIIPGISEWYTNMWNEGVRFHYVSNGPIQLLPLILNFLDVARLPPGSIKLKSYAARSLFNDLLKAPAARKRDGLLNILDSFEDSKFILIGDSGEQDLELYAQLATQYPTKILAIFIRDVDPDASPIRDPTGKEWKINIPWRNNTDSSYGTGSAPNMSLSNSLFVYKSPASRFVRGTSWFPNTPSPPWPSVPLPLTEEDQPPSIDVLSSPIYCERESILDDRLSRAQPIKKSASPEEPAWLPSSPHHLPGLSSSPLSVSALDQVRDVISGLPLTGSRSRGSGSNGTEASFADVAEVDGDLIAVANRPLATIGFADEMPMPQSPEMIKSSISTRSGASPKPSPSVSPSRRRTRTIDEGPAPSYLARLRPGTLRRTTTNSPSMPGTDADSPPSLTSASLLSLSRNRSMSTADRKREELQERVWRARSEIPEDIVLRIFRHPAECVEAEEMTRIVK